MPLWLRKMKIGKSLEVKVGECMTFRDLKKHRFAQNFIYSLRLELYSEWSFVDGSSERWMRWIPGRGPRTKNCGIRAKSRRCRIEDVLEDYWKIECRCLFPKIINTFTSIIACLGLVQYSGAWCFLSSLQRPPLVIFVCDRLSNIVFKNDAIRTRKVDGGCHNVIK